MLKIDDDVWLDDFAIHSLMAARRNAVQKHGNAVLAFGGIMLHNAGPKARVPAAKQYDRGHAPSFVRVSATPSPLVCHRMDVLRGMLTKFGVEYITRRGWDTALFTDYAAKFHKAKRSYATVPSLGFHMGATGVHLIDNGMNRDEGDPLAFRGKRPREQKGGKKRWIKQYGGRRRDPAGKLLAKTKGVERAARRKKR